LGAQWRYRLGDGQAWRLKKRRLGLARQERDGNGGWRKRKGRCPDGWLDEHGANVAAVAAMGEHAGELLEFERREREAAEHSGSRHPCAARSRDRRGSRNREKARM
jgi:hypothetical protein